MYVGLILIPKLKLYKTQYKRIPSGKFIHRYQDLLRLRGSDQTETPGALVGKKNATQYGD